MFAFDSKPCTVTVYNTIINCYFVGQAKSAFMKAIKADVLFIEPVLCLAEIHDRQQNTVKAIEL